ncbi:MAG: HD-GYP domain-containing protein [Clostridiales bacterium]|jgi:putative nucleotidyltransferase with HDIG domain|nr:HD-GYP domain-containing protein [Clostridiales bacterium]
MPVDNQSARRIAVENLKPGMVLARDLVNEEGAVVLQKNTTLDMENFKAIVLNSSSYVLVLEDSIPKDRPSFLEAPVPGEKVPADIPVREQEDFKVFVSDIQETTAALDDEIKRIADGEPVNRDSLFAMTDSVMGRLKTKSDVILYVNSLKESDESTYSHSVNVSLLANLFAIWINAPQEDMENLTVAAMLHDIGMTKIPQDLINKKGPLSREEFDEVKKHPTLGYRMLDAAEMPDEIKLCALSHHERIDGSGYPLGIKGDKINSFAKIIGILDVYEAMISDRSYRARINPFEVIKSFEVDSYGLFDTQALLIFLKNIAHTYLNSHVRLSDGTIGRVAFINENDLSRPMIKADDGRLVNLFKERNIRVAELL